jgi:multidrug efflux pump
VGADPKANIILFTEAAMQGEMLTGLTPVSKHRRGVRHIPALFVDPCTFMHAASRALTLGSCGSFLSVGLLVWSRRSSRRQLLLTRFVGGLIVSQILTLYTTPVIYLALDQLRHRKRKRPSDSADLHPIRWTPLVESPAR